MKEPGGLGGQTAVVDETRRLGRPLWKRWAISVGGFSA